MTCTREGCGHPTYRHTRKTDKGSDGCTACDCEGMPKPGRHDSADGTPLRRCSASDLFTVSSRRITDEGYLVAPATLARTGVQIYRARELGLTDGDPERLIRLYRPPEEVLDPESLASFNHKPVTLGHPPVNVTAENWDKYAVGDVHDVKGDGSRLMTGEMIVRAQRAVDAVARGKAQLSNGYEFDFDQTPGTSPEGEAYDGVQRRIRGNHNAIVDHARGGSGMRIADEQTTSTGDQKMPFKKTLDGTSLEFADEAQASLVERIVDGLKAASKTATDARDAALTQVTAGETALAAEKTAAAKLVADHATEVATLKAQIPTAEQLAALTQTAKIATDHAAEVTRLKAQIPTPEQLGQLAAEHAKVVADALSVIPGFKAEGKTMNAIRIEVLAGVIAANDSLKRIAQAGLGGAEPSAAAEGVARLAFDAVVAAGSLTAPANHQQRGSVNDPVVARALAGGGNANDGVLRPLTGVDVLKYRETHAGKAPPKRTSA